MNRAEAGFVRRIAKGVSGGFFLVAERHRYHARETF